MNTGKIYNSPEFKLYFKWDYFKCKFKREMFYINQCSEFYNIGDVAKI